MSTAVGLPSAAVHCERQGRAAALWLKARPKAEALLTSEGVSLSVLTRREAPC